MAEDMFERILSDIIKGESGIKKVILVDRSGLTISHVSRDVGSPVDIESIGAIASAVFGASEEQGKNLRIGKLDLVTSEFENGKIFAASCGQGILTVVTDNNVNIGMVRYLMQKTSEKLKKVLDEFLSAKPYSPEGEDEFSKFLGEM
ncbi:MAG: roadblock/LC7 domain-containing protein [Candidatus Odinarchaeota archaeon]|nr:roadblock/LC7 domain-containing protein [Candidatus Odinarchaeota archaeon]